MSPRPYPITSAYTAFEVVTRPDSTAVLYRGSNPDYAREELGWAKEKYPEAVIERVTTVHIREAVE